MHLSFLSDSYLSDSIEDDAEPIGHANSGTEPVAHLIGLLRGLVFLAVLACPPTLALAAAWLHRLDVANGFGDPSFVEMSTSHK